MLAGFGQTMSALCLFLKKHKNAYAGCSLFLLGLWPVRMGHLLPKASLVTLSLHCRMPSHLLCQSSIFTMCLCCRMPRTAGLAGP